MTTYLFVQSTPVSGEVEGEFDQWYDAVHIPQVVEKVAGVVRGTRHLAQPLSPSGTSGVRRRLTIYELDHDDVAATLASLVSAMQDGSLDASDLIDRDVDPPQISAWTTAQ